MSSTLVGTARSGNRSRNSTHFDVTLRGDEQDSPVIVELDERIKIYENVPLVDKRRRRLKVIQDSPSENRSQNNWTPTKNIAKKMRTDSHGSTNVKHTTVNNLRHRSEVQYYENDANTTKIMDTTFTCVDVSLFLHLSQVHTAICMSLTY